MRVGRARLLIRGGGWTVVSGSSGGIDVSVAIRSVWRRLRTVVVVVSDSVQRARQVVRDA